MKALKYLDYKEAINFLTCPRCYTPQKSTLQYRRGYFFCKKCKQKYPIKNRIIQLINPKMISKQVKNELKGNIILLTKENIKRFATKDKWSSYYNHFVNQKINYLMQGLEKIKMTGIVSLGSGPGFEIKQILKRKYIPLVFSSDLAYSATRIVPYTLEELGVTLCLFTSDLNYVPVLRNTNHPILVYEALHHTKDSHKTLEGMLKRKYHDLLFVEPCTNFLIKIMARIGLAQREEYSGLIPDFIDLNKVKSLADKYGYEIKISTIWEVPEEYIRKICKKGSLLESILLLLIDFASMVGKVFNFGSFAIVHLRES